MGRLALEMLRFTPITANALWTFGTAGHHSSRKPGYFNAHSWLSRTFKIAVRLSIDARVEGFNVTVHWNFNGQTTNFASGIRFEASGTFDTMFHYPPVQKIAGQDHTRT